MRTAVGLIEVTSVEPVDETTITRTMRAGPAPRPSTRCGAAWADRPVFRVGLRGAGEDPRIALRQRPPTEADLAWPEAPPTTGTITSTAWARPSAALGVQVGQLANSLVFDADGAPLLVLIPPRRAPRRKRRCAPWSIETWSATSEVWAADGVPHAVFPISFDDLVRVTGGEPADLA